MNPSLFFEMNLVSEITTAPAGNFIDFREVKEQLRVGDNDIEDRLIRTENLAAIDYVEGVTWRVIQSTTFTGYMDFWASVEINKTPVTSITSVKYYDEDDNIQTMPTTDYNVNLKVTPATITFDQNPTLFDKPNAIEIEYIAGYTSLAKVPKLLLAAIYVGTEQMYDFRMGSSPFNVNQIEMNMTNMLAQYTVREY